MTKREYLKYIKVKRITWNSTCLSVSGLDLEINGKNY